MNGRKAKAIRSKVRALLRGAGPSGELVSARWYKVRRGVPCRLGNRSARALYKAFKRIA